MKHNKVFSSEILHKSKTLDKVIEDLQSPKSIDSDRIIDENQNKSQKEINADVSDTIVRLSDSQDNVLDVVDNVSDTVNSFNGRLESLEESAQIIAHDETAIITADANNIVSGGGTIPNSNAVYEVTKSSIVVSSTAAGTAAKTASYSGFKLVTNKHFQVKFTTLNSANNPTLNINGTGAKRFYYNDTLVANLYHAPQANEILDVYYDGTYYKMYSTFSDGLSGSKEPLHKSVSSKTLLSNSPFVNAYLHELYFEEVTITSVYTVKIERNYNRLELTFYKDGTEIGTVGYTVFSGSTTAVMNSAAPSVRSILNSDSVAVGRFLETRTPIAKYYIEKHIYGLGRFTYGTFTLNTHLLYQSMNQRLNYIYAIAPIIPSNLVPTNSTNVNVRDGVLEVYVPNANETSVYQLQAKRYQVRLVLNLLKDSEVIGNMEITAWANPGDTVPVSSIFNGVMHQLKNGNNVVAYVILKKTAIYTFSNLDATIYTANLKNSVISDITCSHAINFKLNANNSSATAVSPWKNKVIAIYGDSVSSGSDAVKPYDVLSSWFIRVGKYIDAAKVYNRSIPGTSNKYGPSGGRISGVYDATGFYSFTGYLDDNYNVTYESYLANPSQVTVPAGNTVISSAGCSWSRITHMFPTDIRSTIAAVFVFFHNDGSSSVAPTFIPSSDVNTETWKDSDGHSVDREWYNSSYYATYGGDFNIYETTGGLYSTVMKLQAWMPQALIILCTPWSGAGTSTNLNPSQITVSANAHAENVRDAAKNNSVPLIDVNAKDGVNGRNRSLYVADGIHPNADGGKMIARVFCSELQSIIPKF